MAALADNPRILVTGATGFIGTPLCARLDELGHPVTALTRDIHRARERLGDNVQLVTDLNELERTVFGGVINLAGEPLAPRRWIPHLRPKRRRSRMVTTEAGLDYFH